MFNKRRNIICKVTAFCMIFLAAAFSSICRAQELSTTIQVDRSRINNTSLNYLDNLPDELEAYLNDHAWTSNNFQKKERINANIQITLLSVSSDYTFTANIVIRTMRPIYNTTRQTTLFLYNDENWSFNYTPNRSLVHDELQFDGIATLLDYYAYIMLGYDYDSFSELGGTDYFSDAQNMVSIAQSTSSPGWQRTGTVPRNRAQLISDLLNPNYEALRRAIYMYHRKGLDLFLKDPEKARQNILDALTTIQKAKRQTTGNLLFNTFFNAKYREIVSVFIDAPTDVRLQAYNLLSDIDQSHLSEYSKLQ